LLQTLNTNKTNKQNQIIHHYNEAIRIYPQYGKALYNLATYLHNLNHEEVKDLIMKEGEEEDDSGSHYFRNPNFDLFEETVRTFHWMHMCPSLSLTHSIFFFFLSIFFLKSFFLMRQII
jgi:hypothetical protein